MITQALEEHLGTRTLRHTRTWVLKALEIFYLADTPDAALECALDGGLNAAPKGAPYSSL